MIPFTRTLKLIETLRQAQTDTPFAELPHGTNSLQSLATSNDRNSPFDVTSKKSEDHPAPLPARKPSPGKVFMLLALPCETHSQNNRYRVAETFCESLIHTTCHHALLIENTRIDQKDSPEEFSSSMISQHSFVNLVRGHTLPGVDRLLSETLPGNLFLSNDATILVLLDHCRNYYDFTVLEITSWARANVAHVASKCDAVYLSKTNHTTHPRTAKQESILLQRQGTKVNGYVSENGLRQVA